MSAAEVNQINAYTSGRVSDLDKSLMTKVTALNARIDALTQTTAAIPGTVNAYTRDTVANLHAAIRGDQGELARIVATTVWTTAINWGTPEEPNFMATLKALADAHSFSRQSLALDLANAEARRQAQSGPVDYDKVAAVVAAELNKLTITTTIGGTK